MSAVLEHPRSYTDNGREFISLAYDRKYDGVRLVKLPNEEVQLIIKNSRNYFLEQRWFMGRQGIQKVKGP